jgi:hypothetical protein
MRWLTNGLRHLNGAMLPTSSALTRARQLDALAALLPSRPGHLCGSPSR